MQVSPLPPARELDMLLTAGERMSMSLVAMAIANLGHRARSFTGSQAGVITDSAHGRARIIDVTPGRIQGALDEGDIAIVAGFQGVSQDSKDITTLGRGGSDTTAVALAAALKADVCEIYTDVDGVFTADPRIVPTARKVHHISNEEMLEMAACGAKVLHLRCVEYARRFGMPIHVRSSFSYRQGTWISDTRPDISFTLPKTDGQVGVQALGRIKERVGFASLQYDDHIGKLSLIGAGMRSHPGVSATLFRALADSGVNIEMISTSEIRISVVTRDDQLDDAVRAVHTAFGLDSAEGEAVVYGGSGR